MRRFILVEKLLDVSDNAEVPVLSSGIPDWKKIFSTAHPIDTTKSSDTYLGMTTAQLWETFWDDDDFLLATGITSGIANPGKECDDKFGSTLSEELLNLGFNKKTNPFLAFLESTYLKNNTSKAAFAKLQNSYNALHNAYINKYIQIKDLSIADISTSTDTGKILHNAHFYDWPANQILEFLKLLKNNISRDFDKLSTDAKIKYGSTLTDILANILVNGMDSPDLTNSAKKISEQRFLSYSEVTDNISMLFEIDEEKEEAKTPDEALADINQAFFLGTGVAASKTNWNTDTKVWNILNNVLSYLAISTANHTKLLADITSLLKTGGAKKADLKPGLLFSGIPSGAPSYDNCVIAAGRLAKNHTVASLKKLVKDLIK